MLNPTLISAIIVVTFALLFYSIGVFSEQRSSAITRWVLFFLTAGLVCDITSTTLMIIGSTDIATSVHGFLGYSALAAMLIDTILIWVRWSVNLNLDGDLVTTTQGLHIYTRLAYIWWVIAYIAGVIISILL